MIAVIGLEVGSRRVEGGHAGESLHLVLEQFPGGGGIEQCGGGVLCDGGRGFEGKGIGAVSVGVRV